MTESQPNRVHFTETRYSAKDGAALFVRMCEPRAGACGAVLIVHGFGEHSGRYLHVMEFLAGAGFRVAALDLRGHGRSAGRRGDIRQYSDFYDDLEQVWSAVMCGQDAHFLYGHSLGGQIVLNFAAERQPAVSGLVIASPWLRLAFTPPAWKVALAQLTAKIWPGFSQPTEIRPERLSRDLGFLQTLRDPALVNHTMSARMFLALTRGAQHAGERGRALRLPMLMIHGDCDPVTSAAATDAFYLASESPDKKLMIIPGAYHETHNDLCRHDVLAAVRAWLLERSAAAPPARDAVQPTAGERLAHPHGAA